MFELYRNDSCFLENVYPSGMVILNMTIIMDLGIDILNHKWIKHVCIRVSFLGGMDDHNLMTTIQQLIVCFSQRTGNKGETDRTAQRDADVTRWTQQLGHNTPHRRLCRRILQYH